MNDNEKALSIDELLSGIWRRRALAAAIAGGVMLAGIAYLLLASPVYTAQAVIRVNPQELPVTLMTTTVNERVLDRLTTVRNELLSRPVLEQVVQEMGLYPELVQEKGIGAAADALRRKIEVRVEGENAFAVIVEGGDAEQVAAIANRLPEIYATRALEERAQAADRAARVFEEELQRIQPQVAAVEARIAEFKAKHAASLPESLDGNLRQLDRLNMLTNTALMNLADAHRRRTTLAHQGLESTLDLERFNASVAESRRELASLESIYTPEHPEVVAARRNYQELKERFETAAAAVSGAGSASARLDAEIAWLKETADGYREEAGEFLERVRQTPGVGAQLAGLHREYEALSAKWEDLLSRKVEAELARDLERRQKASIFHVAQPAHAASAPAEPNPVSVLGLGFLAALGLGLGTTGALASRDTSLRGAADARTRLGLPVLATVPDLDRASKRAG